MAKSVHFMSTHDNWSTPKEVYDKLNSEFSFRDDPCPLGGNGGLEREWRSPCFVNPPYSDISKWVKKAWDEVGQGNERIVVMLIPSRTDTRWWHDYVMKAAEIRFIKGRLKFGGAKNSAPFPSCIVVFRNLDEEDGRE